MNPTLSRGGIWLLVGVSRKKGSGAMGQPCSWKSDLEMPQLEPLPCLMGVLPTALPARATVGFLKQREPVLGGASPLSTAKQEREEP